MLNENTNETKTDYTNEKEVKEDIFNENIIGENDNSNKKIDSSYDEKDKSKKNNNILYLILKIVVIILLLGLLYLFVKRVLYKEKVEIYDTPTVKVTKVQKGNIGNNISVAGNIIPKNVYYLASKLDGDIRKIYVENGDYVKKGDPVVDLDCDKEIEAAFIQYDTAKNTYERMQKLYNAGDISKQQFETVKAQYDVNKLKYDTLVEYSHVVANADGKIEHVNMTENTAIKTEHLFCVITTDNYNEINFGVTERVLNGLKIGDKVGVERNNSYYDGFISNISTLINTDTGLFDVKAKIITDDVLPSGSIAKVDFSYEKKENVYILPNDIIYYDNGHPYVYIVNNDSILEKKFIELGIQNEIYSEIISGISPSYNVLSTWIMDLNDGKKVIIDKDNVSEGSYVD